MTKINSAGPLKAILGALCLSAVVLTQVEANTFPYVSGDVLLCIRKSPTGAQDLLVNVGNISYFTNLAPNTTVPISTYTGTQLGQVGTNSIAWSAWAYLDASATRPNGMTNTIYMTSPRDPADNNTQTTPYYRDTKSTQGQVVSKLSSIAAGAVNNANFSGLNSATAVLESESYNLSGGLVVSYAIGLGNNLNFNDSFQSPPEQYTAANFTTGGTPVRADFYCIVPTVGNDHSEPPSQFLGYFQLSPAGVMTYTAYPSATVAVPVIISFTRTNATSTVTFTTGSAGTYSLRGTNSAGLSTARASWPVISSVAGDGNNHSLSDVTAAAEKFYTITAQ